jgi:Ni2+-binding GTPase involved in maturation of urease and hydrogenase
MTTTRIIFVGGFLGAGKTTLLWEAAQRLINQGLNIGLITNDQAPELVDTALLARNGLKVSEVSGSCFCCNFNGLTDAIQKIRADAAADVIIAEPVGSCTDLSATIIQPLKQYWARELQIAPLSVLADPVRLKSILDGDTSGLHADAAYIFRKQLEESDIILISKTDQFEPDEVQNLVERVQERYHSEVMKISSINGDGLDGWLKEVLQRNEAGQRITEVDYDIYAHGEAVLGWLNGTVLLKGQTTDWDVFTRNFLVEIGNRFDKGNYAVGHVKVIAENNEGFITGNLTGKSDTLSVRGSAGQSDHIRFVVNARVETSPEILNGIIRETLDNLSYNKYCTDFVAWKYLQPGRPNPTHRFKLGIKN